MQQYAVPRPQALLVLGVGLALLAAGVLSPAAARVLIVPVGVLVVVGGARDLVLRPVLAADEASLLVADLWRRRRVPWPRVAGLRVVRDRRTDLLEVDLGDTVVVLSRRRLGCPPERALQELQGLRLRAR